MGTLYKYRILAVLFTFCLCFFSSPVVLAVRSNCGGVNSRFCCYGQEDRGGCIPYSAESNCTCDDGYLCILDHPGMETMGWCEAVSCGGAGETCCRPDQQHPQPWCDMVGEVPGLLCKADPDYPASGLKCFSCGGAVNEDCCEGNVCKEGLACIQKGGGLQWVCCEDSDGDGECDEDPIDIECGEVGMPCCFKEGDGSLRRCLNDEVEEDPSSCYCNGSSSCTVSADNYGYAVCIDRSICGYIGQRCCDTDQACIEGYCYHSSRICLSEERPVPTIKDAAYNGPVIDSLEKILGPVVKILYYGGLMLGIFYIIISGYKLMVSQGNPQQTQDAQEQLTAAILGIIFILLSVTILRVILGKVMGITM